MSNNRGSLSNNGVIVGQLKKEFSFSDQMQIESISGVNGSLGKVAGGINKDVTGILKNLNHTTKSTLELGSMVATSLDSAGITRSNIRDTVSAVVSKSVVDHQPFHRYQKTPGVNMSNPNNRGNSLRKTPSEIIQESREVYIGQGDYRYEGMSFPSDLKGQGNASSRIRLDFWTYERPDPETEGTMTFSGPSMFLPLPENFEQNHTVKYGEQDTGGIGRFLSEGAPRDAVENLRALAKSNKELSVDSINQALGDKGALLEAGAKALGAQAVAKFMSSSDLGGLIGQELGMIPNPHPTVFFQGVDLRRFVWQWKLIPRSRDDRNELKKILNELKKAILPKRSNMFLKYPKVCQPKIEGAAGQWSDQYKKCFVRSMNVNYSGEGTAAQFKDGSPFSVILSLEFQEMQLYLDEAPSEGGGGGE